MSDLTPEEEAALVLLDEMMCGSLKGHAPTDVSESSIGGPIWSMRCAHGCGYRLTYTEFSAWIDANPDTWRHGRRVDVERVSDAIG